MKGFAARFGELTPSQRKTIDGLVGTPEAYALLRSAGRMRAYSGGNVDANTAALIEESLEVKAALTWAALNHNEAIAEFLKQK